MRQIRTGAVLAAAVAAAVAILASLAGAADDPTPTPGHELRPVGGLTFVDELELTIANLVVSVTDADGQAVTNLTADDFVVSQDGVRQPITNFQLYTKDLIRQHLAQQDRQALLGPTPTPQTADAADTGGAAAGATELEPRPVYAVLYIDNENLEPLARNRALGQARHFIADNLKPPVQMMVVTFRRSLKVLQPFTSDSRAVMNAIKSVLGETGGRTARNNDRRDILKKIEDMNQEDQQRSGYSSDNEGQYHSVYRLISGYAREEANTLHFTIDALRQVITSLSGLPGKKMVLYVSGGLPMIPGLDLYYQASSTYQDHTLLTKIFEFDRTSLFQGLVATANAQDVALYTISTAGVEMQGMGSAEHANSQDPLSASLGSHNYTDSLRMMADETGGVAIFNTNNVAPGLERVAQDMYTYYSIGYPLKLSGKDVVHKVKVEVPGHPDYTVRYRQRFVEKSAETRIQDRVVSSLMFEIEDNPMQLEVTTGNAAPATEDRWLLPTHISFPLRNVALLPEGTDYVARLVTFVAVRDEGGDRSDLVRQEHEVRIPAADYEQAQRQRFGIDSTLLLESGRYTVSVAVYDPITRQDSYASTRAVVNPEGLK